MVGKSESFEFNVHKTKCRQFVGFFSLESLVRRIVPSSPNIKNSQLKRCQRQNFNVVVMNTVSAFIFVLSLPSSSDLWRRRSRKVLDSRFNNLRMNASESDGKNEHWDRWLRKGITLGIIKLVRWANGCWRKPRKAAPHSSDDFRALGQPLRRTLGKKMCVATVHMLWLLFRHRFKIRWIASHQQSLRCCLQMNLNNFAAWNVTNESLTSDCFSSSALYWYITCWVSERAELFPKPTT